jgi:hypothetical protein
MIPRAACALLTAAIPLAAATVPVSISVDLDGTGSVETVTAAASKRGASLTVRSGEGKTIASAEAPGPRTGAASVRLSAGSLGSAGALLEAIVTGAGTDECRSVWRLAGGSLLRVPVSTDDGSLPDCGPADGWTWSWDQPSKDAPARYRRERLRETPGGTLKQVESFRYAGFKLERDPERSVSEIRGLAIPSWFGATLYPKSTLESLYTRYDLSSLRAAPRLVWRTDPDAGVFDLEVERDGKRETMPVVSLSKGADRNERLVTVRGARGDRQVRMTLAGDSSSPAETVLANFDEGLDGFYTPAMRIVEGGLRIFASASDELGSNGLAGTWTGGKGETMAVTIAAADPLLLQISKGKYRVEIDAAPAGIDALLLATDGAPPFGVRLRGPNALERVPLRCGSRPGRDCKPTGPGDRFHRVGARLNSR